ncbi:MAG: DUF5615 family PIN-like protein [Magnetococcales bacterium]|nr:DUF5615 family PIN-like protein [Magnetococcales bacterium]
MRYLIDAQLPMALARFLSGIGREAEHVADAGLAGADDTTIWKYAIKTNSIIVTKDDDFIKRGYLASNSPSIVWIRVGNTSKKEMISILEKTIYNIEKSLLSGEKIVEVVKDHV